MIKKMIKKTKKMTVDDLAIMVQNGFASITANITSSFNERMDRSDERIDTLESNLNQKIQGLSNRIDNIVYNFATRDEVKKIDKRLTKVEDKASPVK